MFAEIISKLLAQMSNSELDALRFLVYTEIAKRGMGTLSDSEKSLLQQPDGKREAILSYRTRLGSTFSEAKEVVENYLRESQK